MKKELLEKQTKNPALFLLAMLKEVNATMKISPGRLEIGPVVLAKKLAPKIIEHKANLARLIIGLDCSQCGFPVRMQGQGRVEGKNTLTSRFCSNSACLKQASDHVQPDFPVYNKNGKEI